LNIFEPFNMLRYLLVVASFWSPRTCAFSLKPHLASAPSFISRRQQIRLFGETLYGKGAEIWPPTNEGIVDLKDSFPNGILPDDVAKRYQQQRRIIEDEVAAPADSPLQERRKRRWTILPPRVTRILRRAATGEEENEQATQPIDRTPAIVGLACLSMVQPIDLLLVTFLSGYFCLLANWSNLASRTGIPSLPALPPQGHVPVQISNPLGYHLSQSPIYDKWLKLGIFLGLFAPVLWIYHHTYGGGCLDAALAGRPLFLLCCQAISESLSRRQLISTPLPIRILIPVAYNSVRLTYLWRFVVAPGLGWAGLLLAISNFLYWSVNLFGFLIPVATMKYMRTHFFFVEAQQVTIRVGMEETVGLTPY
jgi:hypothetical protein